MREALILVIFTMVEIQVSDKIQQPEILVDYSIYEVLLSDLPGQTHDSASNQLAKFHR